MEPEIDTKLERLIHRQLKELPPLKAPSALLTRVLATVRQRQSLPWWQQSIWHWPIAIKAAFLLFAAGIMLSLTGGTWWAEELAANPPEFASKGISMAQGFADTMAPLGNAFWAIWRSFLQTALVGALISAAALYLICIGAGTLFVRQALKRA